MFKRLSAALRGKTAETTVTDRSAAKARVLTVDDNEVNLRLATYLLESLGFQADAMDSGMAAIEAASKVPYDIIVMDCRMPDIDGFEATRRIRAAGQTQITIIGVSADSSIDRKQCLVAGMNDFLEKPLRPETLARVLRGWIADKSTVPEIADTPNESGWARVINEPQVLEWVAGDANILRAVVPLLITDMQLALDEIYNALSREDSSGATLGTHSLAGLADNVGSGIIKRELRRLNDVVIAGDLSKANPAYESLWRAVQQCKEELNKLIGRHPA